MTIRDNRKVALTAIVESGGRNISVMHPGGRIEDITLPVGSHVVWLPIGSYLRTGMAVSVVGATTSELTVDNLRGDGNTWYIIKEGVHYSVEFS